MYLGEERDYKNYFFLCQTVIIPDCKNLKYYPSVKYLRNFSDKPDVRPSNTYFKGTRTDEKIHANFVTMIMLLLRQ